MFAQGTASSSGTGRSATSMVQHRVQFLTTVLSLTPDQQQQATTIFTNAANADASARGNLKTAHQTLKTAIQNNDAATIEQTATAIGTLTAQTTANNAKAQAAFYQILTADQKTKYGQLGENFHGPGGFRANH